MAFLADLSGCRKAIAGLAGEMADCRRADRGDADIAARLGLLRGGKAVGLLDRDQVLLQRDDRHLRHGREIDLRPVAARIVQNRGAREHAGRTIVSALAQLPLAEIGALGTIFVEPAVGDIGRRRTLIAVHGGQIDPVRGAAGRRIEPASIEKSCHVQLIVKMPLAWSRSTVNVLPLASVIGVP